MGGEARRKKEGKGPREIPPFLAFLSSFSIPGFAEGFEGARPWLYRKGGRGEGKEKTLSGVKAA